MSSPYIHAALLLHFAKQPVSEDNVKKILGAAGISVDESRVKALISAISEVNIEDAIKSPPIGFAAPAAVAAPASESKPVPKEKKEEKKEEEALAGLGALFG